MQGSPEKQTRQGLLGQTVRVGYPAQSAFCGRQIRHCCEVLIGDKIVRVLLRRFTALRRQNAEGGSM